MITEITVPAQRRSENAQDVPISIQAMTARRSSSCVSTFDDYIQVSANVYDRRNNGPARTRVSCAA